MPVCENCGTEYGEGQKFCFECGAPIPQTKKCIKCGAEIALKMKFCPECGTKQDGSSAVSSAAGLAMGDKNVIAGDVIGHKEETHIAGNATIIKNEDETKKVKKCHICGSIVLITDGFVCPDCGEFTCNDCYDETFGVCTTCSKNRAKNAEKQYKEALSKVLEDGRIELSERRELESLQKKLGISPEKARLIEDEMRNAGVESDALTIFEERSYKEAFKAFYDECEDEKALELIEPLYNKHPLNEKVLSLYLPVLAENNACGAMNIIDNLQVDFLISTVTAAGIAIRSKDFDNAERVLKSSMSTWSDKPLYNCYRALFYFAMYRHFSDKNFLIKAKEIAETLSEAEDELSLSYITKLQIMLAEEDGDTSLAEEFTKEFCKENGLFWRIINSNPLDYLTIEGEDVKECSKAVVNVVIPEGVRYIREKAFYGCTVLKSIKIPDSVKSIGEQAFENCTSLESIIIPDSVKSIGEQAFEDCTSLESIIIPNSITEINEYTFEGCTSLKSITLSNVSKLNYWAFAKCTALESIKIPDSMEYLGQYIFEGCSSLKSVEFDKGCYTEIGSKAFFGCPSLKSIEIPPYCKFWSDTFEKHTKVISDHNYER